MTRNGKIARLPRVVREELNSRLENGETGPQLAEWLNSRDDVRAMLAVNFGGRPVNEQNLTEWRDGGFTDWQRHRETRDWIREIVDKSTALAEDTEQIPMTDWLSAPLAVALGRCIQRVATDAPNSLEDRHNLLALARELGHLRRGDHHAEQIRLQRERWEAERNQTKSG